MKLELSKIKFANINLRVKRGFTIIETLVAITVLMIAIAGPLVVANNGLVAALYAKDQAIASFLAQDAMEMVRNVKDVAAFNGGTSSFNSLFNENLNCRSFGGCDVYLDTAGLVMVYKGTDMALYANTDAYPYSHLEPKPIPAPKPTIFSRSVMITPITTDKEFRVSVKVSWNEGKVYNELVITSEMVVNVL